jgi:membrane-bound lytic murein transglycosylase D
MKLVLLLLLLALPARADLADLLDQLDPEVASNIVQAVKAVTGADAAQLNDWAREFQEQYAGEYIIPIGPWRDLVRFALPVALPVAPLPATEADEDWEFVIPKPQSPELPRSRDFGLIPVEPAPFWQPPSTKNWPVKARALAPQLKSILAGEGVPPELVWIAQVESAFNPQARSRSGAVGLFQLMPQTAGILGLSTWPRDERKDPVRNARASARYLAYLYRKFQDWPLVLAAYNGGEGRVRRLLNAGHRKTFREIADDLPEETQCYVPRVAAAVLQYEGALLSELPPVRGLESRLTPHAY